MKRAVLVGVLFILGGVSLMAQTPTQTIAVLNAAIQELQATLAKLMAERDALVASQPVPVDCFVSDYQLVSTAWGVCQPNGTQDGVQLWERTVLTQPANGGLACPVLQETRTVSQPCVYVPPVETCNPDGTGNGVDENGDGRIDEICTIPPPSTEGPYDFFLDVSKEPDITFANDLRDNAFLLANRNGNGAPAITYDPAHDTDPRKQDAAKLVIPASNTSIPNASQVRISIGGHHPESRAIFYDLFFTDDFLYSKTAIDRMKGALQIAGPKDAMHWPIHVNFKLVNVFPSNFPQQASDGPFLATPYVNTTQGFSQLYDFGTTRGGVNATLPYTAPSNQRRNYESEALGPRATSVIPGGAEFGIKVNTWTRYAAFFERDPTHDKLTISTTPTQLHAYKFYLWMLDETRDAMLLYDGLVIYKPQNSPGGWVQVWYEFNCSAHDAQLAKIAAGRGPLVAYVRNLIVGTGTTKAQMLSRLRKPAR